MNWLKRFFSAIGFGLTKGFYHFKKWWSNFWTNHSLIKKALFTISFLILFLIGTQIKIPYVTVFSNRIESSTFFNTLNLVSGGGLKQFSLMALGISPFITASLIMSLLQTRLFPPILKLSQSGPQGRRKINIITRALTLVIAVPQAILLSQSLAAGDNPIIQFSKNANDFIIYGFIPLVLIGGSLFSLFMAEEITEKGIGNGTSLIIFTGIAMQLPATFRIAFSYLVGDLNSAGLFTGIIKFISYIIGYLVLILIIVYFYLAERHIPIQQIGVGRSSEIKEMGKLPIKANPAGIMPIIFAFMVLSFPNMIANILPTDSGSKYWILHNMQFYQPIGFTLLMLITFLFSIIIGLQQSRVDRIAEDFVKNSTFIPGIRPGEDTEDYLIGVVFRLSLFSAFYLCFLAGLQYVMIMLGMPQQISFGGTSMMILVSVALETVSQVKARRKTSKMAKSNRRTKASKDHKGLLW